MIYLDMVYEMYLQGLEALVQLFGGGGAQQQTLDRLVLQRPGDRQLSGTAAQFVCQRGQVFEAIVLLFDLDGFFLRPAEFL